MENAKICNNYNLDETIAKDYLAQFTYPWEALAGISDYIKELGPTLDKDIFEEVAENVWVAKSAEVAPSAHLGAPLIVDENAKIGHGAFIRTSGPTKMSIRQYLTKASSLRLHTPKTVA